MAHILQRFRPAADGARATLPILDVMARLGTWNDARRTRAELSRLSAHQLDDIGLERSDIDRLATRRY